MIYNISSTLVNVFSPHFSSHFFFYFFFFFWCTLILILHVFTNFIFQSFSSFYTRIFAHIRLVLRAYVSAHALFLPLAQPTLSTQYALLEIVFYCVLRIHSHFCCIGFLYSNFSTQFYALMCFVCVSVLHLTRVVVVCTVYVVYYVFVVLLGVLCVFCVIRLSRIM